jgi:hypothetical protein
MIFTSKPKTNNVLSENVNDNVRLLDIYKNKVGTFKLFCDVKKADGTIGHNNNFAISILTSNGFVVVADNNDLGIPKIKLSETPEEALRQINEAFEIFKNFANNL